MKCQILIICLKEILNFDGASKEVVGNELETLKSG